MYKNSRVNVGIEKQVKKSGDTCWNGNSTLKTLSGREGARQLRIEKHVPARKGVEEREPSFGIQWTSGDKEFIMREVLALADTATIQTEVMRHVYVGMHENLMNRRQTDVMTKLRGRIQESPRELLAYCLRHISRFLVPFAAYVRGNVGFIVAVVVTTIKVYANCLRPDIEYKTLCITYETTCREIIQNLLNKYRMRHRDPRLYYLTMEVTVRRPNRSKAINTTNFCPASGDTDFSRRKIAAPFVWTGKFTSKYKSLLVSEQTTVDELIQMLLSCYSSKERVEQFSLYEVCEGEEYQRKLHPDDLPLKVTQRWTSADRHLRIRRNPDYNPHRRKSMWASDSSISMAMSRLNLHGTHQAHYNPGNDNNNHLSLYQQKDTSSINNNNIHKIDQHHLSLGSLNQQPRIVVPHATQLPQLQIPRVQQLAQSVPSTPISSKHITASSYADYENYLISRAVNFVVHDRMGFSCSEFVVREKRPRGPKVAVSPASSVILKVCSIFLSNFGYPSSTISAANTLLIDVTVLKYRAWQSSFIDVTQKTEEGVTSTLSLDGEGPINSLNVSHLGTPQRHTIPHKVDVKILHKKGKKEKKGDSSVKRQSVVKKYHYIRMHLAAKVSTQRSAKTTLAETFVALIIQQFSDISTPISIIFDDFRDQEEFQLMTAFQTARIIFGRKMWTRSTTALFQISRISNSKTGRYFSVETLKKANSEHREDIQHCTIIFLLRSNNQPAVQEFVTLDSVLRVARNDSSLTFDTVLGLESLPRAIDAVLHWCIWKYIYTSRNIKRDRSVPDNATSPYESPNQPIASTFGKRMSAGLLVLVKTFGDAGTCFDLPEEGLFALEENREETNGQKEGERLHEASTLLEAKVKVIGTEAGWLEATERRWTSGSSERVAAEVDALDGKRFRVSVNRGRRKFADAGISSSYGFAVQCTFRVEVDANSTTYVEKYSASTSTIVTNVDVLLALYDVIMTTWNKRTPKDRSIDTYSE
ncbi:hypothetical protein WN51_04259 [Melipona quadrifasciata]|uniref:Ras-associating domain-containing protein n=1 Tax=Melipona quadrifasciata TaxID=166423 RepID=A0A0N1IT58_9HYME|nr:hypothetical protein WN51_04259 [Melipona quadrifasciata]